MAAQAALFHENTFMDAIQSFNTTAEAIQNSLFGPIQSIQAVAEACVAPLRVVQELAKVFVEPIRNMEYIAKMMADQQRVAQDLYESISWMFPTTDQKILELRSSKIIEGEVVEVKPILKTLVSFYGDHVEVNEEKIYPKMNATHVLAIKALVELSDENGICLNSQIENYFREKGLVPLEGRQQRERIRVGLRDGMRFLGIHTFVDSGDKFSSRIRNKGYLCKNSIST